MARSRKRRPRVVINGSLGDYWSDYTTTSTADQAIYDATIAPPNTVTGGLSVSDFSWNTSPYNADFVTTVVESNTPIPSDAIGMSIHREWPSIGYDTWTIPTNYALLKGKIGAATDTIVATADELAAAAKKAASGFVPILIGIAALVLFIKFGGHK